MFDNSAEQKETASTQPLQEAVVRHETDHRIEQDTDKAHIDASIVAGQDWVAVERFDGCQVNIQAGNKSIEPPESGAHQLIPAAAPEVPTKNIKLRVHSELWGCKTTLQKDHRQHRYSPLSIRIWWPKKEEHQPAQVIKEEISWRVREGHLQYPQLRLECQKLVMFQINRCKMIN